MGLFNNTHKIRWSKFLASTAVIFMAVLLISCLTFYDVLSAGKVIPSNHCEGGDCCIQSDCSCPNCEDRGEPGKNCDKCNGDSCENCGNCFECGASPCPLCKEICFQCGNSDLCNTCNGCKECGLGCKPLCPECGEDALFVLDAPDGQIHIDHPAAALSGNKINILLFAPFGTPAWAIFSILLTATGVVITLLTVISIVRQKKSENNELDKHTAAFNNIDSYIFTQIIIFPDDYEKYNKQRRSGMLAAMYIFSIAAVLLLVLTQDFNGVIVLFDWWVIIHSILFAGILISRRMIYRKTKKEGAAVYA